MFEWTQVAKMESQAVPMVFIVCTHGGRFSGARLKSGGVHDLAGSQVRVEL